MSQYRKLQTLSPLARMKVSGEITDENDMLLTNYNGEVSTTIFDKTIPRQH
jgi:hypothetical protein